MLDLRSRTDAVGSHRLAMVAAGAGVVAIAGYSQAQEHSRPPRTEP